MSDFGGRVAVITGAASGLGLAIARRAAGLGMKLVLADVERQALARVEEDFRKGGCELIAQVLDVSDAAAVAELADQVFARFGRVDLLFNNAGVAPVGLLWEQSDSEFRWAFGVNVLGVANGIRSFVPRMLEQKHSAHIVNTASVAGFISPTTMGLYNATKHAVVTLSETLHHDLRTVGATIGVTVLCPAYVPTGIADSERNRPDQATKDGATVSEYSLRAREAMQRAVQSGKLSADDVALQTFQAIEQGRFYLFTHPAILGAVEDRHAAIQAGGPPSDPFARKPVLSPGAKPS